MLDIRLCCENCERPLPPDSSEALVCSFECTWCTTCNDELLNNVCPNCGGGLEKRPIRPKSKLDKYPPKGEKVYKPIDKDAFMVLREKLINVPPENR